MLLILSGSKHTRAKVSPDGSNWTEVKDASGTEKVFTGNTDQNTPVEGIFPTPVWARHVELEAKTYNSHPSMRFAVLVTRSMSLVNPIDSSRDYSSTRSPASTHSLSMLDSPHAWSAQSAVAAWMTIDLQTSHMGISTWGLRVSGVVTQGKNDADEWVTRYTCEYSSHASASGSNSAHWTPVDLGHVFHGNSDRGTKVASTFSARVVARKVKITIVAWHGDQHARGRGSCAGRADDPQSAPGRSTRR